MLLYCISINGKNVLKKTMNSSITIKDIINIEIISEYIVNDYILHEYEFYMSMYICTYIKHVCLYFIMNEFICKI